MTNKMIMWRTQPRAAQKVFFDGEMRDVALVADVLAANGRSQEYIFQRIGFLLGFTPLEEAHPAGTTETVRYPCTFDCIIERMPPKSRKMKSAA